MNAIMFRLYPYFIVGEHGVSLFHKSFEISKRATVPVDVDIVKVAL